MKSHKRKGVRTTNIVICGVGGQGIILASNVLCNAAAIQGLDVKKSEVHGMAQRGGTVITHVRFGEHVFSPLIEEGTADYLLAFEKLEALRYIDYIYEGAAVIINDRQIPPMSVLVGVAQYPRNILPALKKRATPVLVAAEDVARKLGNMRTVNIVLLGVLAQFLALPKKVWQRAIRECVKEKYIDLNIKAFNEGISLPLT